MLASKAQHVGRLDPELARNACDLVAFLRANPFVGRRQREETLDKVEALLVRRAALELASHEKILSRAKQTLLSRGHLDDERGLLGRQCTFFLHQTLHEARLVWRDQVVGRRQPAQDECKPGDVPGLTGLQPIELRGDLLNAVAVGRLGLRREAEK